MISELLNRTFVLQEAEAQRDWLAEVEKQVRAGDPKALAALSRYGVTLEEIAAANNALGDALARAQDDQQHPEGTPYIPTDPVLNGLQKGLTEIVIENGMVTPNAPANDEARATRGRTRGRGNAGAGPDTSAPLRLALPQATTAKRGTRGTRGKDFLEGSILDAALGKADPYYGLKGLRTKFGSLFRKPRAFNANPAKVSASEKPLTLFVFGDWGTGLDLAQQVSKRIGEQLQATGGARQQHVVHLGDVYYVGDPEEYKERLLPHWPVPPALRGSVGSWSLNGNHDMYSGGHGYFDTLLRDQLMIRWHADEHGAPSSFFLIEDKDWQVFGLDTSWDLPSLGSTLLGGPSIADYTGQNGILTEAQVRWMSRMRKSAKGCILLTHHQPGSSRSGEDQHSRKAVEMLKRFGVYQQIDAWIWGHEHRGVVFKPKAQRSTPALRDAPEFCACMGHAGVPVTAKNFAADKKLPDVLWEEDRLDASAPLYEGERVVPFGFARMDMSPGAFEFRVFDHTGQQRYRKVVSRTTPTRGRMPAAAVASGTTTTLAKISQSFAEPALTRARVVSKQDASSEVPQIATTNAPTLKLALIQDGIEKIANSLRNPLGIQAIAVGHYVGVRPQQAEWALDDMITRELRDGNSPGSRAGRVEPPADGELLLTLFTDRGLLRGELGQPFIIPHPRDPSRIIVLAGMGVPGHFGIPELTVAAQELCWTVGRLQKKHLASVLIGAGTGNLSIKDAIGAWLRGIRRALASSDEDRGHRIHRLTFVERDPRTLVEIDRAIKQALQDPDPELNIDYTGPSERALQEAKEKARENAANQAARELDYAGDDNQAQQDIPVRITVGLQKKTYHFAAITASAAVPQREILLDPKLVNQANAELAGSGSDEQKLNGQFLEQLLIPTEIRPIIYTPAPIVLLLDAATARVHWEMVARSSSRVDGATAPAAKKFDPEDFLGTRYGLTRQLRTTFAPAPEPPPPPKRVLKVLIVADPAADAPLAGAIAEAQEVAETFERFNAVHAERTGHRVEVHTLFGPGEATRTTVLKKLMTENFDVLHFAGHCAYDTEDPANSGWIFAREADERITANELKRVDRVPKFIFSNACESGITPDRSNMDRAGFAPSFAETFFARGVANFVCTAWEVDDEAARTFAGRLYSELLGVQAEQGGRFAFMHEAMRDARRAIAEDETGGGSMTWGAYQHYGNPYFQFFQNGPSQAPQLGDSGKPAKTGPAAAKSRRKRAAPKQAKAAGSPARKRKRAA